MFQCKLCDAEFRDGVQCTVCLGHYDFPCAGITEVGYRKLGDRQNTWKCASCKKSGTISPLLIPCSKQNTGSSSSASKSPTTLDTGYIAVELKRLSAQVSSLPTLVESVKAIQTDLADLKKIKDDIADLKLMKSDIAGIKTSIEFAHQSIEALTTKVSVIDQQVQSLLKTKDEVNHLRQQMELMQETVREQEQRSRMNNIEIKGIPLSNSENLFSLVTKIGELVKCPLAREQINYVARVPMRNDKVNKSIIVAVHNRYLKEDFVAAAKKVTITPVDLNLQGNSRIFVNDHLTLDNKLLLNKAKALAKDRNYTFAWVRGCKIFLRKNHTSPVLPIRTEKDLKKLLN